MYIVASLFFNLEKISKEVMYYTIIRLKFKLEPGQSDSSGSSSIAKYPGSGSEMLQLSHQALK